MNQDKSKKTIEIFASIGFLIATAVVFIVLFGTMNNQSLTAQTTVPGTVGAIANVDSMKKEADELIKGKSNFSGMPVTAPAAEKTGKNDPFK